MAKASMKKRIFAYLIDSAILTAVIVVPILGLAILTVVVGVAAPKLAGLMGIVMIPVALLAVGVAAIYWFIRDGLNGGRSFGKKYMGLKVVKDGKPCGYVDSALRAITLAFPLVQLVDLYMLFTDPEGIRLGDKIAKTKVVEA